MQDTVQRLAHEMQRPGAHQAEAMLGILGQALGLTLCVASLNSTAMLQLQCARLDALGNELTEPVPGAHWAAVLVRPAASSCDGTDVLYDP